MFEKESKTHPSKGFSEKSLERDAKLTLSRNK